MRKTFGLATSCLSSTFGFVRSISFSSLSWLRGELFTSGVTGSPMDAWVAQQLREATPFGQAPHFLIRDRDGKYGQAFTRVAVGTSLEVLKTPHRAPKANALCERFLGSVQRECLDHILVLGEQHLYRVIREYVEYFNHARPHQGIGQKIPERDTAVPEKEQKGKH